MRFLWLYYNGFQTIKGMILAIALAAFAAFLSHKLDERNIWMSEKCGRICACMMWELTGLDFTAAPAIGSAVFIFSLIPLCGGNALFIVFLSSDVFRLWKMIALEEIE